MKEGVACYQDYLRGLLDITDNLVAGTGRAAAAGACATTATTRTWWSPPTRARRPSPTTPTRSARSTASGSATPSPPAAAAGYDHKEMGITARGAWESGQAPLPRDGRRHPDDRLHRRRHRRHVGRRVRQRHAAVARTSGWWPRSTTATSSSTRTPTRRVSFAERERLFELPRSSWADYDATLISAGGGVWPRSAKSIPLSPQARAALGIDGRAR